MSSDQLAECGSAAAYRRHLRRGEPIDAACRAAQAADTARYAARRRARRQAQSAQHQPRTSRQYSRDQLLDEWEHMRGWCTWHDFPDRAGISLRTWERAWYRAKADGDPRAVLALADRNAS